MDKRYFVDERSGIVAVRDRYFTDREYNGLHSDTNGVVKSWGGVYNSKFGHWSVPRASVQEAVKMCASLNSGLTSNTPDVSWTQYRCFSCDEVYEFEFYDNYTKTCSCGVVDLYD